jgi:hypothetical protein
MPVRIIRDRNIVGEDRTQRKARLKLSENDIERQIVDWLCANRWIVTRQQSGLFQRPGGKGRVRIGEVGLADWRAERPTHGLYVELFYFEVKAPGKLPSRDQANWLAKMWRLGFEADWFDGLDKFLAWYRERFK